MAGDPARMVELLWRHGGSPARGPRQGHSVDEVVDAAVAVADAEGLPAVSIRRVAHSLGVATMSVYTYVPGKAELVDLMVDSVYLAMPRPRLARRRWRGRLTAVADGNWSMYREHPWMAAAAGVRPVLGPGQMAKYEHELSAFDGLGLDDVTVDDTLNHLLGFVLATARAAIESREIAAREGIDDAQWWQRHGPALARVLDESAYPRAARIGIAAGAAHGSAYAPDHAYRFGLARLLDGIAALLD